MLRVFQKSDHLLFLVVPTREYQCEPSCPDPNQTVKHHSVLSCYQPDLLPKANILPSRPVTKQNVLYHLSGEKQKQGKERHEWRALLRLSEIPWYPSLLIFGPPRATIFLPDHHTLRWCATKCFKRSLLISFLLTLGPNLMFPMKFCLKMDTPITRFLETGLLRGRENRECNLSTRAGMTWLTWLSCMLPFKPNLFRCLNHLVFHTGMKINYSSIDFFCNSWKTQDVTFNNN